MSTTQSLPSTTVRLVTLPTANTGDKTTHVELASPTPLPIGMVSANAMLDSTMMEPTVTQLAAELELLLAPHQQSLLAHSTRTTLAASTSSRLILPLALPSALSAMSAQLTVQLALLLLYLVDSIAHLAMPITPSIHSPRDACLAKQAKSARSLPTSTHQLSMTTRNANPSSTTLSAAQLRLPLMDSASLQKTVPFTETSLSSTFLMVPTDANAMIQPKSMMDSHTLARLHVYTGMSQQPPSASETCSLSDTMRPHAQHQQLAQDHHLPTASLAPSASPMTSTTMEHLLSTACTVMIHSQETHSHLLVKLTLNAKPPQMKRSRTSLHTTLSLRRDANVFLVTEETHMMDSASHVVLPNALNANSHPNH